jgi:Mn-dependent DtxR family transcriptional regulator
MKTNQSLEDYLEAILLLSEELEYVHQIEVARKLNVSQPAVQKALKILKSHEYTTTDGLHIYLTPKGKEYAQQIYHRHCIIRSFLLMHGVDEYSADVDACVMEHGISLSTFTMMEKYVAEHTA